MISQTMLVLPIKSGSFSNWIRSLLLLISVCMAILTDQQLQQIAAANGIIRRQNIIISGDLRRHLTGKPQLLFHRSVRKTFAVLDDTQLSCYESESDWHQNRTPSLQVRLSSIRSIQCWPTTVVIGYISDCSQRLTKLKLTSDNRARISVWKALLQASLPGRRSIQNFACTLRLPKDSSIREIVDCLSIAFPKDLTKGGGCFQPKCTFSPAPQTKYCPFHKRIHADRQFRFQIGHIRRLIEDCRMDLEQAITDVIANVDNSEDVRRDSIQLLWDICSCISPGSYQEPLKCENCELGALKFLNHIALMSQRQTPDQIISEGLLDVLLHRTSTNLGDCRVKRPGAWPAVFAILAAVPAEHRQRLLHTINFLLIENKYNCSTLSAQNGWQHFIYSGMIAERADDDLIIALSLNIFVIMSYDALINTDHFLSTTNETLLQIHQSGGLDQTSLVISRAYLIALSNKIATNIKLFPINIGSRAWVQSILCSDVVLRYLCRTADWGQDKPSQNRLREAISSTSFSVVRVLNQLRHGKHFHSSGNDVGKFPIHVRIGTHESGDLHGDIVLANKMISLYQNMVDIIHDPGTLMDAGRDPYIVKDAESLIERFRQLVNALKDAEKHGTDSKLQSMIKESVYFYH